MFWYAHISQLLSAFSVYIFFIVPLIALVAKTTNLQKIPFAWHIMNSEDYEKQVKAKGDMKRFDFIHMIQVFMTLCYPLTVNCWQNVSVSLTKQWDLFSSPLSPPLLLEFIGEHLSRTFSAQQTCATISAINIYTVSSDISVPNRTTVIQKHLKPKCLIQGSPQLSPLQMIYYVDNLASTIKFYHSLLKNNGRLMIIIEAGK